VNRLNRSVHGVSKGKRLGFRGHQGFGDTILNSRVGITYGVPRIITENPPTDTAKISASSSSRFCNHCLPETVKCTRSRR
jgi:hypothetical protein